MVSSCSAFFKPSIEGAFEVGDEFLNFGASQRLDRDKSIGAYHPGYR